MVILIYLCLKRGVFQFAICITLFYFLDHRLNSSVSIQSFSRLGSLASLAGSSSFSGDYVSVLGQGAVASTLSLRSYARFGSSLSVTGATRLGFALSVLDSASFGSPFSV
jgi:hypothetical protein